MPLQNRWNVISYIQKYITDSARSGNGEVTPSVFNDGSVAANYAQTSTDLWENEIQKLDLTNGADLFTSYCAGCHGVEGKGLQVDSTGGFPNGLAYPAPLPKDMPFNYVFWRISDGVPDTRMGPFSTLLTEADIYDLSAYLQGPVPTSEATAPATSPTSEAIAPTTIPTSEAIVPTTSPTPTAKPGG